LYVLDEHKTGRHIGIKEVPLGLEEQDILGNYLTTAEQFVFTKHSKRGFGKPWTVHEYDRYISRAINRHNLSKIVPYELRHTSLSNISNEFGRDAARAVAGHTTEAMTSRYDHSDPQKAFMVARERNRKYLGK